MICSKCGNENLDTARFCTKCGAPLDAQPDPAAATQPSPPGQAPSVLQKFLNEQQDPVIVQQVHKRVSQILTREEEILYIAMQNKPLVNVAPDCVVLTNRRFIIYKPKLLGGASFEDYIWRDLRDARLTEGIMGATLTMLTVHNRRISLEYLPKAQARRLYAFARDGREGFRGTEDTGDGGAAGGCWWYHDSGWSLGCSGAGSSTSANAIRRPGAKAEAA